MSDCLPAICAAVINDSIAALIYFFQNGDSLNGFHSSKRMADVAAKNSTLFMQRFVGQQMLVLCEEQDKYGLWTGHTDNYLKVSFTGDATRGDGHIRQQAYQFAVNI